MKATGVLGFQDAFLVGGFLTLVTLFLVFLLPSKPFLHKSPVPLHLE